MASPAFDRTASLMAYLSAAVALAYSLSFGYYVQEGDRWAQYTSSGLLIAGGLVGLPVLIAIHLRVRHVDEGFAIVAFVIAAAAALGTMLHGAHDIAVFAHPEKVTMGADNPNFTDPRGFSTPNVGGSPSPRSARASSAFHCGTYSSVAPSGRSPVAAVAQPKAPSARSASISVVS